MTIDEKELALDYAKRCGWPNSCGLQIAAAEDIAKAMLAFHKEMEAAKAEEQPVEWSATDDFCLRRDFEEWAVLPPKMSIEKDGDGEYEDAQTRWMYKCFEVGYRKGMWGAARHINDNIADELLKANQRIEEMLREPKRESSVVGIPTAWQPIETAPKDGTNILLWWPLQFHCPVTGHFATKWSKFYGWKVSGWEYDEPFKTEPTHWMPLP